MHVMLCLLALAVHAACKVAASEYTERLYLAGCTELVHQFLVQWAE